MTVKIGQLYTHFLLDGLFIVVYNSNNRYGLRSFETGNTRYISHEHFPNHYTFIA